MATGPWIKHWAGAETPLAPLAQGLSPASGAEAAYGMAPLPLALLLLVPPPVVHPWPAPPPRAPPIASRRPTGAAAAPVATSFGDFRMIPPRIDFARAARRR